MGVDSLKEQIKMSKSSEDTFCSEQKLIFGDYTRRWACRATISRSTSPIYEMVLDGWCHRAPARPNNSIVEFICTTRLAAASAFFARGSLSIKRSARCSWWRARTSGSLPCPPTRRVRRRSLGNRSTRSHCHIHAKPHHPEAAARHAQMAYASSRRRRRHGLPRHMWPLR